MAESRLSRRSIKQSKKQLYGSLIGIVVVIFVGLNFGPYLIGILGGTIDAITGKSRQTTNIIADAQLEPPALDPIPQATPDETINLTGRAFYADGEVEFFLNNSKYKTVKLEGSQDFEINNVKLSIGENIFSLRMVRNNKKSEFSKDYKISYIKDAPKLEISFPQDGASFDRTSQEITIKGVTSPETSVKINEFIAIVDSEGNFSYFLRLSPGENKIKITAENAAKKTITKEITVSYSE